MTIAIFDDLDELLGAAPLNLGCTPWLTVERSMIEAFASSTWIAFSDEAPPWLLLSLTNHLLPQLLQVPGATSGVNYGAARVRFGSPVTAGERLRGRAELLESGEVPGGVQKMVRIAVEVHGRADDSCVVDSLSRWLR